jgi:gamma-glutamyl phosphate reductase
MTADVSHIFENARVAARKLNLVDTETIDKILLAVADEAEKEVDYILQENCRDLALMPKTDPKYDRLMLSQERILGITADMRKVAGLPSPLGRILASFDRPNGMRIEKVSVPFGVIGIIYEARPNVTFDVFSLCLKSGNVCILKGGSDAQHSNNAIINIINKVLISYGIDSNTATLLPNDHSFTDKLLTAVGQVDLIIPRGSGRLINYVREHALVPVIETGAGICHTYFDSDGDLEKGRNIVFNAKTRRVSVCNALDCLIIHRERLSDLANLCKPLSEKNVLIYADPKAYGALAGKYPESLLQPATDDSFGTEFLDYKMAIKTVDSFEEALAHIARYSSKHSESIITENESHKQRFAHEVDAACVYTNVSTAFTDGGQFGFGAEIGISTQKLHARGPMALPELTTYKYIISGNGQTRQ